jgi:undecaprenyl-diphosphatase
MLLAAIFAFAFVALTVVVFEAPEALRRFDARRERLAAPLRTRGWSLFFSVITFFGDVSGIALASLITAMAYGFDMRVVILGTFAVGGSAFVAQIVKVLLARARPEKLAWRNEEFGYSYPSGNATAAVSLYGLVAVLSFASMPGLALIFIFLILGIGFSRLALSVHYASDVLGGYLLGAAFLALAFALF